MFRASETGLNSPVIFLLTVPRQFLCCSYSFFVRLWINRSKAVVPVLVLLFVALWFILRFVLCFTLCHFVLVFFSPFSIAITSLGEEGANLSAFRTFVRFVLVWICRFPLPLGVWEGLRFVIVALPGLFSYLFFVCDVCVVLICSLSLLLLVPREGCASWLWHFLVLITYDFTKDRSWPVLLLWWSSICLFNPCLLFLFSIMRCFV